MKKDFNDPKYWEAFGRMALSADIRPSPQEAVDHIFSLMARISKLETGIQSAKHEAKCANQQFSVFAMEVSNLANKYTR